MRNTLPKNVERYSPWLRIVGIGDDGWAGLSSYAQNTILAAEIVIGSERQIAHLRDVAQTSAISPSYQLRCWPPRMMMYLEELLQAEKGRNVVIIASGDPMLHGIGVSIAKRLPQSEYTVIPAPSAMSLACARMGWGLAEVHLCSMVTQPFEVLYRYLHNNQRVIVYSRDGKTPQIVAQLLCRAGFEQSRITLFAHLGGNAETSFASKACDFPDREFPDLNLLAIEMDSGPHGKSLSLIPGLPDDAFVHDGQITKHEVRALTLSALAPLPGERLWDVGAGSGAIGIEWLRSHPTNSCIAFESQPDRLKNIRMNALRMGVPQLESILGYAPQSFGEQEAPDAVFIGGGVTKPGVVEAAIQALRNQGRLVVNAVTLESEALVVQLHRQYGGNLTRIAISRAEPLGTMHGWRSLMPITQWIFRR